MKREIERTLYSLSIDYQHGIDKNDYEVLIIDNGSKERLTNDLLSKFEANISYFYIKNAKSSPTAALNFGAQKAKGEILGLMIDGARLLTPGILSKVNNIFFDDKQVTVSVLGWHLGPKLQKESVLDGYDQNYEDRLLQDINWQTNGYRLFEISTLAGSNQEGWYGPIAESNCFFVSKEKFNKLGGMNEKFVTPGGGIVNLDFYKRATEDSNTKNYVLLKEGTFHQIHDKAVSSNIKIQKNNPYRDYLTEYKSIYGYEYAIPKVKYEYI